jgi:hypothetical protein
LGNILSLQAKDVSSEMKKESDVGVFMTEDLTDFFRLK